MISYEPNSPVPNTYAIGDNLWRVEEDFNVTIDGLIYTVNQGFEFDYASIPKIFWNIISPTDYKCQAAAVVHDLLYRLSGVIDVITDDSRGTVITKFHDRQEADEIFLRLMKASGVGFIKRYTMYHAVRLGGWMAWKEK